MASQNLSEILFKPKFDYPETSVISNSGCDIPDNTFTDSSLGFYPCYYRQVQRYGWVTSGGNLLDIDEALSNICMSKAERSRPEHLDTVKEYGPGHWNYEFNSIAQRRVVKANELALNGEGLLAAHNYRMASRYFGIAAYPNLKGDILAANSYVLCKSSYRRIFEVTDEFGSLEEVGMTCDGKKFTGLLHLPTKDQLHGCLIAVVNYSEVFPEFFSFYKNTLLPGNIALLLLEMPGFGGSASLSLSDHYSGFVENAIDAMASHRQIDPTKIALYGSGIGATACIRAAVFKASKLKALCLDTPYVNSVFTDPRILKILPLCYRSAMCNRLGLDASDWDSVIPQFKSLSLKTQGLISASGKCSLPTYIRIIKNSIGTADDIKLIENHFKDLFIDTVKDIGYETFKENTLKNVREFLTTHIGN